MLILDFLKEFRSESRMGLHNLTVKIDVMDDRIDREAHVRDVEIQAAVGSLSSQMTLQTSGLHDRVAFLEDWRKKIVYPAIVYAVLAPIIAPLIVLWLREG